MNDVESLINAIEQCAETAHILYSTMMERGASTHEADVALSAYISAIFTPRNKGDDNDNR